MKMRCTKERVRHEEGIPFSFLLFSSTGNHSAQDSRAAILLSGRTPELPMARSSWEKGEPSRCQVNRVEKRRIIDRAGGWRGGQLIINQQTSTVVFP